MHKVPIASGFLEASADSYLHASGGLIMDAHGHPARLVGINWFGLETPTFAPRGLGVRGCEDMMCQMKQLGFNTIRLPFCSQLFDAASRPKGIDFKRNPDLMGRVGLDIIDKIVEYASKLGLRIILDHHRSAAGSGPNENGLWFTARYPESSWIAMWSMLASRYAGNPWVIGADLHNEPHEPATWGSSERSTDWRLAAERAGNAILAVNPHWLIFVEGIEKGPSGHYWWGGNLSNAAAFPVRLDIPGRLIYSAHDYPASIFNQSWFDNSRYPRNLPAIWDRNWGYLVRQNIAPVFLGEFGSKLATHSDQQWLNELVRYLNSNGGMNPESLCEKGSDPLPDKILISQNRAKTSSAPGGLTPFRTDSELEHLGMSWAWWSWNPDSSDTGGILNKSWTAVDEIKMSALAPAMFPFRGNKPAVVSHH
jgi:endoglucanase